MSVVIPCFNAEVWIGEALKSVACQDVGSLETIVVDDGSIDASASIVRREFEWVRLIEVDHQGSSRARNLGTRAARGRFIQYLDADDMLAPGKMKAQLSALEASGADVAYGSWQEVRCEANGITRPGRVVDRRIEGSPEIELFTDFWCPPAAYLFRRELIEKVDSWNERLPVIQDARFVLDCALHGGKFVYCPGIMAYYRIHASESLSRRDPVEFVRDCLRNAVGVEQWWRDRGELSMDRRAALIKVYSHVARASFHNDHETFEAAYHALVTLAPGYVPESPRHLAAVARLIGYRRAEAVALRYRRAKRLLRTLAGRKDS